MYVVITSLRILHDISRTSNMKRSGAYIIIMWKISLASKQKEKKKKALSYVISFQKMMLVL